VTIDWRAVSERIRSLVESSSEPDLPAAAQQLGVSESQLREAVSGRSRFGSLRVLAAVIRVYGVDPSWLMTGEYDGTTHRASLEGNRAEIDLLLKRLIRDGARPSHERREPIVSFDARPR
jgi:hypothetical protein